MSDKQQKTTQIQLQQPRTIGQALGAPDSKKTLRALLGLDSSPKADATLTRYIAMAYRTVLRRPDLARCNPVDVLQCVFDCATMKMELDGELGHAYIVSYKGKPKLQLGYKGKIVLAKNSGVVEDITPRVVWGWDEYSVEYGSEERITHISRPPAGPMSGPSSWDSIVAAYAIASLSGGKQKLVWLWRAGIEEARSRSSGYRAFVEGKTRETPWVEHPGPMSMKTAVHRICGTLPLSIEDRRLVLADVEEEETPRDVAAQTSDFDALDRMLSSEAPVDDGGEDTKTVDVAGATVKTASDPKGGAPIGKRDGGGPRQ